MYLLLNTYFVGSSPLNFSYVPEGNLTSCGIDYMDHELNPVSYLIAYTIFVYVLPLFLICYSYWYIIAVSSKVLKTYTANE